MDAENKYHLPSLGLPTHTLGSQGSAETTGSGLASCCKSLRPQKDQKRCQEYLFHRLAHKVFQKLKSAVSP